MSALYRAEPADSYRSIDAEGMVLLYHRPSGATHLLSSPVPEILALLREVPCDAQILTERLCHRLDLPCVHEALMVAIARLDELIGIGLVHKV
jgi:PqqD family protein of HPr-rel-A system